MERFWALGHFNLGKCTALVSVVAGSRRQCEMERAGHTGVDWKMPPVSALHRDMELKVPAKPERRGMALHNPVKPEKKPVVLFPSDRLKPLSVSIPGSRDSWIAPAVGCRDEAAPRGAATCRSKRGTRSARSISRAITLECPIAVVVEPVGKGV